jgi:hypothetical protein
MAPRELAAAPWPTHPGARAPKPRRAATWLAPLAAAALLIAACGHTACPKLPITTPAQALASQHAATPIVSLRAEAKVDQRGEQGRIKGTVLMFVERPDRVRFDAMTQFGPALVFTMNGEQFALSDFKSRRYLTGPACPHNIARLVGVALPGPAIASVLMGEVPPLAAARESMRCQQGHYVIARVAEDGTKQEVALRVLSEDVGKPPEAQRTRLAAVTLWNARGQKLYRVRYEDYQSVGGGSHVLPFTLRVEDFVNQADALVRFKSIDVDVQVPPDAFSQTPRTGLEREEALCP